MPHLVNSTAYQEILTIVSEKGEKSEIFLQPHGRVDLPPFHKVDPYQQLPKGVSIEDSVMGKIAPPPEQKGSK